MPKPARLFSTPVYQFVLVIGLSGLIFSIVAWYINKQAIDRILSDNFSSQYSSFCYKGYKPHGSCPRYGEYEKNEYLRTYIVEEGDTILSIATRELGSSNRVSQIIDLNKDRFPNITTDGFLEIEWILLLPPADVEFSSGSIWMTAAEYIEKDPADKNRIHICGPNLSGTMTLTGKTRFPDGTDFNTGDCIVSLYDQHGAFEVKKL